MEEIAIEKIHFVDTTFRDGQTSLWHESMRTGMILPVAPLVDGAGFQAAEIVGLTFLKKCVRDLGEDPWERIRRVAARMPDTPLRAISGRHMAAFQVAPRAMTDLWVARLAANGVRQIRISDPSNTVSHWAHAVKVAREAGLDPIINLIFSISPKHSDDYYEERARAVVQLDVAAVCLKDPGGLLTPERTRSLVPRILRQTREVPFEFHTHCNTGLGPMCVVEAIHAGARIINTAIPPLANGASNPSVYNVARNARALGYAPEIDEQALRPVSEHLTYVARREGLPLGAPAEYDAEHYRHQVPGGMISNFRFQLGRIGMEDRLAEILEETIRVRADLGCPIMVTPYSQFVGSQAAINVLRGDRYAEVTDEIISYALGRWGEEEADSVEPGVKERILDRARAGELARQPVAEPSVEEVRAKLGDPGVSDDELLLRYVNRPEDVERVKASGGARPYISATHPLVALVGELALQPDVHRIQLEDGEFSLRLER